VGNACHQRKSRVFVAAGQLTQHMSSANRGHDRLFSLLLGVKQRRNAFHQVGDTVIVSVNREGPQAQRGCKLCFLVTIVCERR
jgi:hypothetical protein